MASTVSDLKFKRGSACPCVWKCHIKGKDTVATVHGDDITVGGERSAVELPTKMISRKYEIKKQVLGEDPDLEKSGRILSRVIEWNCDGIAIEADMRHVREILKDLALERANHIGTPCAVDRTAQEIMKAGRGVDADRPRPSTSGSTPMRVMTGTDRGLQMTTTMTARHSRVVTSRGTLHSSHESAIFHQIDQISSLPRCGYAVRMEKPSVRDMERVKRIGRCFAGKPRTKWWFRWQQSGDLEACSDADCGGDKATRRSVSAAVIMKSGHCLKVWTKKQLPRE